MSNPNIKPTLPEELKKAYKEAEATVKTSSQVIEESAKAAGIAAEAAAKAEEQRLQDEAMLKKEQPIGLTTEALLDIVSQQPVTDRVPMPSASPEAKETVKSVRASKLKLDDANIHEGMIGLGVLQARPLAMPESMNVKPKDPTIMFRWVNFKSEEGSRVNRFKSMGFEIAETKDVEGMLPIDLKKDSIGITNYDTVLMKINKRRLLEAYEYNLQKSMRMVRQDEAHTQALSSAVNQLRADMSANNIPSEYLKGRVQYFTPSAEQAEALNR